MNGHTHEQVSQSESPLSSRAWLVLGIGAAIIISAGAFTQWWFVWIEAKAQETIQQQQAQLVRDMDQIYESRNRGDFGGKTPAETLYQYTESVEIGFYKIPSTYFIRSARPQEVHRFDGVSRDKVWQFVLLLKEATHQAAAVDPTGNTAVISSPIKITMEKASNGIWQMATIDYSFASSTGN